MSLNPVTSLPAVRPSRRLLVQPAIYAATVLIALCVLGASGLDALQRRQAQQTSQAIASLGSAVAQSIQLRLATDLAATDSVEIMLRLSDFRIAQFDTWAREIMASNPDLSLLQLAPHGVVAASYPAKGNESVLGVDLLADPERRAGAAAVIRDGAPTFVGPVVLKQDQRLAVIGRRPIYRQQDGHEQFWGFAIAIVHMNKLGGLGLDNIERRGFAYRLYGHTPDLPADALFASSRAGLPEDAAVFPIVVPNGSWKLAIGQAERQGPSLWLWGSLVFVLSLGAASLAFVMEWRVQKRSAKIEALNRELAVLASTDALTGVRNRRNFYETAQQYHAIALRGKQSYSVCIIDIDYFKAVNDEYGHPVGDEVLRQVAATCLATLRASDAFGRVGGEEFAAVLPDTGINGALVIGEKIRERVAACEFRIDGHVFRRTVSVGVAQSVAGRTLDQIVADADRALYTAKHKGRNRVELAPGGAAPQKNG